MHKNDFGFYLIAWPFIGGFISFIIGSLLQAGNAGIGIMIVLGGIGGYIALITYLLGLKAIREDEGKDKSE